MTFVGQNAAVGILLKAYRSSVGKGNYQGDVFQRGRNDGLRYAATATGLVSEEEWDRWTKAMDDLDFFEGERRIAQVVAEDRERDRAKRSQEVGAG